ncbi:MAG: polyprenyl synthetase family protein [Sedimentisphaerales bacterium]|nr:polyprenyl synthetase family protein [Sedimentisphaerales bacterium]
MPDDHMTTTKPLRPPQDNIPQSKHARDRLVETIRGYVEREHPVPPLTLEELRAHTQAVLKEAGMDLKYTDFAAVLVNNGVWRETVAAIPYDKRLLLLPKCLRCADECPAKFDEIGLLCEQCGRCVIGDLREQAIRLGYTVLVAEGSPVVMSLIETGRVEGVVGASCLAVLERVYPYMEAGAVPGIAIPLLQDGCANTSVDVDWLWEALYQTTDDQTRRLDLDALHRQVDAWFSREALAATIAPQPGPTEQVALDWMARAGKRWRPFLAVCTYRAFCMDDSLVAEEDLQKVAVAVECFHKASLIHDDIEDGDAERYGQKTLHAEYGVPIALNVGDLLLGEGYRLLAELKVPDAKKVQLLDAAARGHRSLCLGQGSELAWMRKPGLMTVREVLDIFRMKTAPAFEVALNLGAILAGCDELVHEALRHYSESLGIAYQIRDDLEDLRSPHKEELFNGRRPSILLAMAHERNAAGQLSPCEVPSTAHVTEIEASAWRLMEAYKSQAIASCIALTNASLKGLLRRVIGKMFNDFEIMGCCDDPAAQGQAPARRASAREQGGKT